MQPCLKLTNVQKKYKKRDILKHISFEVYQNEIVGLVGLNGAGKSTIIKTICGLLTPNGGSVEICGFNLENEYSQAIQMVGIMVDAPMFYNYLTAYQNLYLFCALSKIDTSRITEVLNIVGLQETLTKKVGEFSQGMKQRLGIAQALLNKLHLLILDEPTNALDPKGIMEIRKLLLGLAKNGIAILISSHNLDEIESICDRIVAIRSGIVVANEKVKKDDKEGTESFNKFILKKIKTED